MTRLQTITVLLCAMACAHAASASGLDVRIDPGALTWDDASDAVATADGLEFEFQAEADATLGVDDGDGRLGTTVDDGAIPPVFTGDGGTDGDRGLPAAAVPLPSGGMMGGLGLAMLASLRRRRS